VPAEIALCRDYIIQEAVRMIVAHSRFKLEMSTVKLGKLAHSKITVAAAQHSHVHPETMLGNRYPK
jgi:hypothetical protein